MLGFLHRRLVARSFLPRSGPVFANRLLGLQVTMTTRAAWTYDESVARLNSFQTNAAVLAEQRKRGVMQANRSFKAVKEIITVLGISQEDLSNLKIIHIAGSKGKGSTSAFTESILRDHGFKTGLFTSPHIIEVRERIRINGTPISRESFAKHLQEFTETVEENESHPPTYFVTTFLLALKVFLSEKVDVAILEVGMGGLFDATNIVQHPVVCGITHIGMTFCLILQKKKNIVKIVPCLVGSFFCKALL
eukprot:m.22476 g.22476  ORF g.22476 m.22476 type:complete len:249 (-) comp5460_c0_seq1:1298-2044(-)